MRRKFDYNKIIIVMLLCVIGVLLFEKNQGSKNNRESEQWSKSQSSEIADAGSEKVENENQVVQVQMIANDDYESSDQLHVYLTGYNSSGKAIWEKKKEVSHTADEKYACDFGTNNNQFYYSDVSGVYAIDMQTGDDLWMCRTGDFLVEAVFGKDGTLYGCGDEDDVFCAISSDGEKLKEIGLFLDYRDSEYPHIKRLVDNRLEVEIEGVESRRVFAVNLDTYQYYPVKDDGTDVIVEMNEAFYDSIQEALQDEKKLEESDGIAYIKLWRDIEEDVIVEENEYVTLNLNHHNINNVADHTVVNYGDLTIMGRGGINNKTSGKATIVNMPDGNITLCDGTLIKNEGNDKLEEIKDDKGIYCTIQNYGYLAVNAASVKSAGSSLITIHNGWYQKEKDDDENEAILIVEDGRIEGGDFAIENDLYGTVSISDGTISGAQTALLLNKSIAEVYGGVFEKAPLAILNMGKKEISYQSGKCTVAEGTFKTDEAYKSEKGSPEIIVEDIESE